MLVVRAPFRVPLGGGGTDLPSYYEKFEGELVSVAINKYMYVSLNRPIVDKLIRVRYSESEKVDSVDKIKHDLVREALRLTGVTEQVEIHSIADLPSGSGMGSSGSYLVALLRALHAFKREAVSTERVAEEACEIEINKLKRSVGKQDQYMAAFGGLTALKINKNGEVKVTRLELPPDKLREIENSLVIFYTGVRRQASDILEHQKKAVKNKDKDVTDNLHQIKAIGVDILKALKRGDISALGTLMDFHWQCKKRLSGAISNSNFDDLYQQARLAGALGGKLMGAGGGGFFLFCCPGDKSKLREVMANAGLTEMFFNFDFDGAKVIADIR